MFTLQAEAASEASLAACELALPPEEDDPLALVVTFSDASMLTLIYNASV